MPIPKIGQKTYKAKQNKALKQNLETEKRIAINYILAKYEKRQKKLLMLNPWHAIVDSIGWISAI